MGSSKRLLGFWLLSLAGCTGSFDRAVLQSALEGVSVERLTDERFPPTNSVFVLGEPDLAGKLFVPVAELITTVSSQEKWHPECRLATGEPGSGSAIDAERVHLWTQIFLAKSARRLGADAVVIRGFEVEASCPRDPAFAAGEALGEAVVGGLAGDPGSLERVDAARRASGLVKVETTIRALAVKLDRSPRAAPEANHEGSPHESP